MSHVFNPSEGGLSTQTHQQPIIIVNKENTAPPIFHYYLSIGLGILAIILTLYYFYSKYEQAKRENDDERIMKIVKQAMTEWYDDHTKTRQKITDLENTQSSVPTHE